MPVDDTLQYIMTNFENLMTDFVATYQTQFPLGKVDDEIWELRTLVDGKISATSGRWNNSNDVWLALEKLEVDYVNCRHEKSLDLLRLFAVVLTKKSLTLLRQFRYLIATKLQPLVFASDKDAFVDISNFWRELILASKLRIKDRRDIDEIDDACFLLFEEYGLTKQDLEDSFLLWTLAGEPVQFVLSNNRTLDNEFVAGIFQSIHSLHPYPTMATFVIGAQSSGKSTLLNRLFGSRFAASNSRTTRGLYLSFRRTIIYDNDSEKKMNIILLDSEGLESTQRENSNSADSNGSIRFDALMALLSLTSSHVLLWNHCKELTSGVTKTFDTAFFNLGGNCFGTLNKRVVVHFALRDMENVGTSEERIQIQQSSVDTVRHSFSQVSEEKRTILGIVKDLDDLVSLNPDAFHPLSSAISSKKDCDLGYQGITLPWSSDVFGSEQIRDLRASTFNHGEIIQFRQVQVTATAAVARMIKDLGNCKTANIRKLNFKFSACISKGEPLNQSEESFIENFKVITREVRQQATETLKQDYQT
ncbi:hypothetical protein HK096_009515 [Nowakowskiella sp. JEL0078]|nr:hypothetical protein HK096_009515 [Nowakowskiella sp. JEL0078]